MRQLRKGQRTLALPSDFDQFINLAIEHQKTYYPVTHLSAQAFSDIMSERYNCPTSIPRYCTIRRVTNEMEFYPVPDRQYRLHGQYTAKPKEL